MNGGGQGPADHHTEELKKGYSFIIISLFISVVVNGFNFINNISNIMGSGVDMLTGAGYFLNIFGLIEIVLIIVGTYMIYICKEQFVKRHEENIEIATKIILIWIVLMFISILVTYLRYIMEDLIGFVSSDSVFYISVMIGLFMGLSVSLIYLLLTKELVSKKIEKVMWSGLGIKFGVSLFAMILLIGNINVLSLTQFDNLETFVLIRDLALFGNIMILIGVVKVYIDRKWRSERFRNVSDNKNR